GTPVLFSQPTRFLLLAAALHGSGTVFIDALKHLLLPTITLTIGILGVILRMIRSGMVDSMNQDYVKTAWSKGLPDWVVTRVHIRRNALLPAVTVIGLLFAGLLGGVVLVEYVFAWKGIGYWATQAVLRFDTGGVMGTTLIFASPDSRVPTPPSPPHEESAGCGWPHHRPRLYMNPRVRPVLRRAERHHDSKFQRHDTQGSFLKFRIMMSFCATKNWSYARI